MGIIIHPPDVPPPVGVGVGCSNCWGVGKTFGDGDTPDSITAIFSGVQQAPGWVPTDGPGIDGIFVLDQVGGQPCLYRFSGPDYLIEIQFGAFETNVNAIWQAIITPFVCTDNTACEVFCPNQQTTPFKEGSCMIIIPEIV